MPPLHFFYVRIDICMYARGVVSATGSSVRNVNIFLVLQDAFIQSQSSHLGKTLLDTILRFTSISLSLLPTSLTSSLTVCLSSCSPPLSLSLSLAYFSYLLPHCLSLLTVLLSLLLYCHISSFFLYHHIFFVPYGFAVLWGTSKC